MQSHQSIEELDIYKKMFQHAIIGIILVDEQGTIVQLNDYAQQLFGYEKKELVGQAIELLLPDDFRTNHVQHRATYQAQPSTRMMGKELNLLAKRKNNNIFPVEISLGHLQINGQLHIITYINNISERRKMEEELAAYQSRLLHYTEDLELKIIQRTKDLEKALQQEKQLGELKSRFVTMASHEFRTPLSSILASAELLEHYLKNGTTQKGQKNVDRIKTSVHHLTTILNDFLNLGKLETHTIQLNNKPVVVQDWLTEILEEVNPTLKKGQIIKITHNTEDVLIFDTYLSKNILLNLLSNASKYSSPNALIYLELTQVADTLNLIIEDKGIGIPKAEQANLFTRFYRASNVENIQGTGLGLTIVKRYLDLMKGRITFESEEEKGSRFIVELPLQNQGSIIQL